MLERLHHQAVSPGLVLKQHIRELGLEVDDFPRTFSCLNACWLMPGGEGRAAALTVDLCAAGYQRVMVVSLSRADHA